jgi:hypothetical protein
MNSNGMSYTKLFSSIVTSTIWTEDANTCKIWVTMLAIANKHGEVQASVPGLAQIAGISLADTAAAVEKFLSPDIYSRTKDDEGRRIEAIDGGWRLLNHAKYRAMASKDESITANAERQRRFRDQRKRNAIVTESNGLVTVHNALVTDGRDIAEAEAEAYPLNNPPLPPKGGGRKARRKKADGQAKVEENTTQMIRIGSWFGRQPETLWTVAEANALQTANPTDREIAGMEAFYLANEHPNQKLFRRTSVSTLLNNWSEELDKARKYHRENNK